MRCEDKNAGFFAGIDTSNYTSSVALADHSGAIRANIRMPLEVTKGERGLRQSDAVFAHVKNFPVLSEKLKEALNGEEIKAIGVSVKPRDVEGSYMPCFLVGKAAAAAMAAALGVPLYFFSHQNGHVRAAAYSSGDEIMKEDVFSAFHVSGGTTEVLRVKNLKPGFGTEKIGGTADLNAGQVIDRIGVMTGMSFPCGPEMEKAALLNDKKIPGFRIHVDGEKLECNLSGLENLARGLYGKTKDANLCAAFTFDFIGKTLRALTDALRKKYSDKIIFSGGVMSNGILKRMLGDVKGVYFSSAEFSCDNAAGIALMCREKFIDGGVKSDGS